MRAVALVLVLAGMSPAQAIQQLTPFPFTGDLFVADSGNDSVVRLQDLNLDGDYNDAGEAVTFYDDSMGPIALTNNAGIAVGPDGTVYVSDTTMDFIIALLDRDGDGTANGANESWIYFDGNPANNAAGIAMTTPQDVCVDGSGVVWVATADSGGGGVDAIIRLEDLGGTPGANDPGEARLYYTPPSMGSIADSIPSEVKIGPGGFVYYVDVGATGSVPKGVYRLHDDVVPNGHCNDPGEVTPYFIPTALSGSPFYWGMGFDTAGALYLADVGNDVIWRATDLDGSLSIQTGSAEEVLYWTAPGSSQNWTVAADSGIAIYTAESQAPDRILRMSDDVMPNGNVNDPGEVVAVYDENVSSFNISNPRSLAFGRRPTLATAASVPIGTSVTIDFLATQGEPLSVWYSALSTPPLPVPSLGFLQLAILPAPLLAELYGATVPVSGVHTVSIPVPNDPMLVGTTIYLQGFAGFPSRLQLSNLQSITFM